NFISKGSNDRRIIPADRRFRSWRTRGLRLHLLPEVVPATFPADFSASFPADYAATSPAIFPSVFPAVFPFAPLADVCSFGICPWSLLLLSNGVWICDTRG